MGVDSLNDLTTGGYNSGFGQHALNKITTGTYNVAIGYNSGGVTTTGSNTGSYSSVTDSSTSCPELRWSMHVSVVHRLANATAGNDTLNLFLVRLTRSN
jgi:hypothetical protein